MKLIKQIVSELAGMFAGDGRLTAILLGVIALCAAAIDLLGVEPLFAGSALLVSCLLLLVESVLRSRRQSRR